MDLCPVYRRWLQCYILLLAVRLCRSVVFKLFTLQYTKKIKKHCDTLTKKTKLPRFKTENLNLTDVSGSENYEFETRFRHCQIPLVSS